LIADAWHSKTAAPESESGETQRLQRQGERLLDLYQEEQIEKSELARRKERLDQERQTLEQRLQGLQKQVRQEHAKEQMLQDFAEFCREIEAGLQNPTPMLFSLSPRLSAFTLAPNASAGVCVPFGD
jgi:predicted RNase H-like nuclease (RuvC/YqgF family)